MNNKDMYKRPLQDLRISVIDRCNFRCTYCMPAEIFGVDHEFMNECDLLSFEEIEMLATSFAHLGVKKIRITGGEPLLRKDLDQLIKKLVNIDGIEDIGLTTNGIYLPKYAQQLKKAGLKRVNISLDAIHNDVFKGINGRNVGVSPVLKGIDAAKRAGLGVKLNMVVKKGMNDHQVIPMASHFKDQDISLRFIEYMDVGNSNGWGFQHVMTKKEILNQLTQHFDLSPVDPNYFGEVAQRYKYQDAIGEIGFITSVSESFCSSCTRARISADGKLFTCLFANKGYDLRDLLQANSTSQITNEIQKIWSRRDDRYSDDRNEANTSRKKIEMSYIGG
ncbi:GTP 3',8-cyclase MoaA [Pontibacillus yanchengensis]|nr:GTP 3',8-cyclase MoaA [Pontibacillus yanchengensis]